MAVINRRGDARAVAVFDFHCFCKMGIVDQKLQLKRPPLQCELLLEKLKALFLPRIERQLMV
ncbi:MAG: hypothetical protein NVS3B5_06680 [Sphingomicrobium sp.]